MMKVVSFKSFRLYEWELIDSPSFRLNPSFCQHLETEGEWCDESIWEINYE